MSIYEGLADLYIAAWNEPDPARRGEIIARAFTEDASYLDPLMHGEGHGGINAMIEAARAQLAGLRFERIGTLDAHNSHLRFSWKLAPEGGAVVYRGTDICTVKDGRFSSVLGFLDPTPQ